jgi:hypothetical protein
VRRGKIRVKIARRRPARAILLKEKRKERVFGKGKREGRREERKMPSVLPSAKIDGSWICRCADSICLAIASSVLGCALLF